MEQTKNAIDDNDGSDDEFFDACEDVRERKFLCWPLSLGARPGCQLQVRNFLFYIYLMRIWRSKNMTGTGHS